MRALVVFDCFGTLVESDEDFPMPDEVVAELCAHGVADADAAAATDLLYGRMAECLLSASPTQPATVDLVAGALEALGLELEAGVVDELLWTVLGNVAGRYRLADGVAQTLGALVAAGVSCRLLSNCLLPGHLMDRLLGELGILAELERCSFSSDGGWRKPSVEAFAEIGEGPFDTRLMVGDIDELDLAPARSLGWQVVLVTDGWPSAEILSAVGVTATAQEASGV